MIKLKPLLKEVSDAAYTIHRFTDCGQNAAQDFIDDNNIDAEKLIKYLKKTDNEGLRNRYMVRDIIGGKTDKNAKQKFIKSFSSLNENTGFDFPHWSGNVKFTPSSKDGKIILVPSSMKDVDGIDVIKQKIGGAATQYRFAKSGMGKGGDADFLELLKQQLEKKLKLKVVLDKGYSGAGYAFDIDMDDLLKKL
jgi:hypothetical protein